MREIREPKPAEPRTEQGDFMSGGGVVIGPEEAEPPNLGDTPFDGTTTGGGGHTNRIDITFDPARSGEGCPCERIRFIQVIQIFIDGNPVDPGDLHGPWEDRDNTVLEDDPATAEDETGTHVDRLSGRLEPYYGGNGAGTGASTVGRCNGGSAPATMLDTPNVPDDWFRAGGGDAGAGNDWAAGEVVFKFEACAFCEAGECGGQFMECVKWTYTKTAADVAAGSTGRATVDGTTTGPSDTFRKAVDRFADAKNFDLPRS